MQKLIIILSFAGYGIVGIFYSKLISSEGGYAPNYYFLAISSMFVIASLSLHKNNYLIYAVTLFSPLSVGIIHTALDGYSMFNPLAIIFVLINLPRAEVSIRKINSFSFVWMSLYCYSTLSILILILNNGAIQEQNIYWLGILLSNIFLLLLTICYGPSILNKAKMTVLEKTFFWVLVAIALFANIRVFVYSYLGANFKRLFAFPLMSTSNYTISVITVISLFLLLSENIAPRFKGTVIVLLSISVLNAQSRSNFVALMVIFVLWLLRKLVFISHNFLFRRLFYGILVILIILLALILINMTGIEINVKFFERFDNIYTDRNVTSRLFMWNVFMRNYGESNSFAVYFFGRGLSSYNYEIRRPHNIYLLLLNQLGIVGLSIFLFALFITSRISKRMLWITTYLAVASFFEPLFLTIWIDSLIIVFGFLDFLSRNTENISFWQNRNGSSTNYTN